MTDGWNDAIRAYDEMRRDRDKLQATLLRVAGVLEDMNFSAWQHRRIEAAFSGNPWTPPTSGDVPCPNDGELVNKRCWKCGWVRDDILAQPDDEAASE